MLCWLRLATDKSSSANSRHTTIVLALRQWYLDGTLLTTKPSNPLLVVGTRRVLVRADDPVVSELRGGARAS